MSTIEIRTISITKLDTDAIVNAANTGLLEGGGVCGSIFRDAGSAEMTRACNEIGHCDEGLAVITPGFKLPAKYVIHAVGPKWIDGGHNEPKLLYCAYMQSLRLARNNLLHSIGFPLISAGIFGYPVENAWNIAVQACLDFFSINRDYDIRIVFAVLDEQIKTIGERTIQTLRGHVRFDDTYEPLPHPAKLRISNEEGVALCRMAARYNTDALQLLSWICRDMAKVYSENFKTEENLPLYHLKKYLETSYYCDDDGFLPRLEEYGMILEAIAAQINGTQPEGRKKIGELYNAYTEELGEDADSLSWATEKLERAAHAYSVFGNDDPFQKYIDDLKLKVIERQNPELWDLLAEIDKKYREL